MATIFKNLGKKPFFVKQQFGGNFECFFVFGGG